MRRMTAQQAAYDLLMELKRPTSSRELARLMLERGMVQSNSTDPIFSFASTIDKNIRDGIYNNPRLIVMIVNGERLVGLPGWGNSVRESGETKDEKSQVGINNQQWIRTDIRLPQDIRNKIQLARAIGFGATDDEVILRLLERGLEASSDELRDHLDEFRRKLDL